MSNIEQRIAVLEQKIQDIDAERESLFQELSKLKDQHNQQQQSLPQLKTGGTLPILCDFIVNTASNIKVMSTNLHSNMIWYKTLS